MSSSGVCGVEFHLPGGAVLFQSHPPPIVLCCWMFTVGVVGGTGELRPDRDWHRLDHLIQLQPFYTEVQFI